MPAPTARRRASPMPSANARGGVKTPPYGLTHPRVPGPYNAYVNYIRRAGCPHPAASSRSYPSTGSHPRRGRRPRRPGNLPPPPISGKTPGPGMPAPTARRRASPMPSANARGGVKTPPYGLTHPRVPGPYNAYVNYIRRAGCPHPAASSRSYPSTGSHPRRGRRPRRPGNLPPPPISGKTPGPGMPAPTARRRASPMPSANARGGVKTPPYGPPHQRVPAPRRKFARPHVNGQPPT